MDKSGIIEHRRGYPNSLKLTWVASMIDRTDPDLDITNISGM
jgi:hypothetical protein